MVCSLQVSETQSELGEEKVEQILRKNILKVTRKYITDKCEATRLVCSQQFSESETFLIWQSDNLHPHARQAGQDREQGACLTALKFEFSNFRF